VHVGDDPVTDIAGARAAGLSAVLLDRSGRAPGSIASLAELDARLELAA
jgi:putative hydrolase of the HAD superfamily